LKFISRTPLRVSLFGGGSDYKEYYDLHGGAVLGGSINQYIYTTCLDLPRFIENKYKLSYRVTEEVIDHSDFDHPVVRAALAELAWTRPINLATMADLPGGTGLGSSSAFTVGLIKLLNIIIGNKLSPLELVRQAYHIEHDILSEQVGIQDHLHAAFGGFNLYHLSHDSIKVEPIGFSSKFQKQFNEELFLVYTGTGRHASSVVKAQVSETKSKKNHSQLKEMVAITHSARDLLLTTKENDVKLDEIAKMLNESWMMKRSLSANISNNHIDEIYNLGLKSGARAGKLCGAGHSGFMLFLVPHEAQPKFISSFGDDVIVNFEFSTEGSRVDNLI
jgi:D-glycero-alpha-D-manno-heptose-7-phosphate kinase